MLVTTGSFRVKDAQADGPRGFTEMNVIPKGTA